MKEPTTYTRTKPIEFSQLQKIVGGYIEMITLKNGDQIVFNEDGISLGLPINLDASRIVSVDCGFPQSIVGHAVVLKNKARIE